MTPPPFYKMTKKKLEKKIKDLFLHNLNILKNKGTKTWPFRRRQNSAILTSFSPQSQFLGLII